MCGKRSVLRAIAYNVVTEHGHTETLFVLLGVDGVARWRYLVCFSNGLYDKKMLIYRHINNILIHEPIYPTNQKYGKLVK